MATFSMSTESNMMSDASENAKEDSKLVQAEWHSRQIRWREIKPMGKRLQRINLESH